MAPVVKIAYGEREPARVLRVASAWGSPALHTAGYIEHNLRERDPRMTGNTAPTNPECKQGKHDNCTEEAWDDALDCLTDCLCMCHDENNGE